MSAEGCPLANESSHHLPLPMSLPEHVVARTGLQGHHWPVSLPEHVVAGTRLSSGGLHWPMSLPQHLPEHVVAGTWSAGRSPLASESS